MPLGDNQVHLLQKCKIKGESNETHPSQLLCDCKAVHEIRDLAHRRLQLLNRCSLAEPVCHKVCGMPERKNMIKSEP